MNVICKCGGTLIAILAMTGCASNNYDFATTANGPSRINTLVENLDRTAKQGCVRRDSLYDLSITPFVHSRMQVFTRVDQETTPAAYIEADIDSRLPLFAFVHGTVSRYDQSQHLLTRHDFDSNLWGAFRCRRELVGTRAGNRETTRRTYLWLFTSTGKETWHPAAEVSPYDDLEALSIPPHGFPDHTITGRPSAL
jgi:hypothetical protein